MHFPAIRCKELTVLWKDFIKHLSLCNQNALLSQHVFEKGYCKLIKAKFRIAEELQC